MDHKIKKSFSLLIAVIATVVIVYFFPHPEASQYKFEEGRPWNYAKLIAPFDIPIRPDSASVRRVRDSIDRIFVPVFQRNPEAVLAVINDLSASWAQVDAENIPSPTDENMRRRAVAFLRSAYSKDIIADEYGDRISEGTLPTIKIIRQNTVSSTSSKGITAMQEVFRQLTKALGDSAYAPKWIASNKIASYLRPNLEYSEETSKRLYDNDLLRFTAVKGVIQQGQTIIDKGAVITPQDYTNLLTYETMIAEQLASEHQSQWMMWLGQFLYVALCIGGLCTFLWFSSPKVWDNSQSMLFIMLLITVFFLLCVGMDWFIDSGAYIVPFAIVPILMIVFFDAPTALFTSLALVLLCGGIVSFPLEYILLQVIASIAAVYSLTELSRRSQLLRTSLIVFAGYVVGYVAIELMMNSSFDGFAWRMVAFLAVSAAISSMAYILMVAIEKTFGFVSVVTLIELSDTNNPLLRQLSQECPGTFQHSMSVATLAADAAIKIGANEQLVRAGALYHDVGKISNPNFYTENQRGVNPHDTLPPDKSAEIIISHVSEGVKRADKAGLPGIVKDFIREHHGRGTARYFYFTYCKAHPDEVVDPKPFTYPGPNPRSIETSLLMMADAVEASSRSLKEHTPEAVRALVNKIIDGQIADGLHNDSPLSFRDVSLIKDAFVRRLLTMYHARVAYPDDPNKKAQSAKEASDDEANA